MAPAQTSGQAAVPAPVGRPRLTPRQRFGLSARDEILDAAAQLFSEQGYAGTSTRAIAMAVGIKQASLYYHFANKEQILAELLVTTVVPSLDAAAALTGRDSEPPEARLWALASHDVRLLCSGRWNLGALYLLPELRSAKFAVFHSRRAELKRAYGALVSEGIARGSFGADDASVVTELVFGLVESAVLARQDRGALDADVFAPTIADACLRLLACPTRKVAAAGRRGARMLDQLRPEAA